MEDQVLKAKRYWYEIKLVKLLLKQKLETSAGFRALSKNFAILILCFNLKYKNQNPTHTTIINWVHKIGYYELTKKKEKANDWIIILDHSIQLGNDKVFVVFGIREKNIDFSRPLNFHDLVPLREITKQKWNGEIVSKVLTDLENEIGTIKYAVADKGSDIKKGLKLANINHIYDLTHKIASVLQKIYKTDKTYEELTIKISQMRRKLAQSHLAYLVPTVQRKKARYQNIKCICDWAMKIIMYLKKENNLSIEDRKKIIWIKEYEEFIKELYIINDVISDIEKLIKHNGLSKRTIEQCNECSSRLSGQKGELIKNELKKYFDETYNLIKKTNKILCTSDIIESAFGKYKNYVSNNPLAGITNLVLCISAFTSKLTDYEIKIALEKTRIMDIKNWTKKFIGKTQIQKRREAFAIG